MFDEILKLLALSPPLFFLHIAGLVAEKTKRWSELKDHKFEIWPTPISIVYSILLFFFTLLILILLGIDFPDANSLLFSVSFISACTALSLMFVHFFGEWYYAKFYSNNNYHGLNPWHILTFVVLFGVILVIGVAPFFAYNVYVPEWMPRYAALIFLYYALSFYFFRSFLQKKKLDILSFHSLTTYVLVSQVLITLVLSIILNPILSSL